MNMNIYAKSERVFSTVTTKPKKIVPKIVEDLILIKENNLNKIEDFKTKSTYKLKRV